MESQLKFTKLKDIDLTDTFFDSLRADYIGFDDWFKKKAIQDKDAYIFEMDSILYGFLFLKSENKVAVTDVTPNLPPRKWLKIGTFKINPHGTRLGERFLKKIFDLAFYHKFEAIYVTVFPKHFALIQLFEKYGFREEATKTTASGIEKVFVKDLMVVKNNILLDYPKFINKDNCKHLLAIYPEYHTKLFPDSILNTESYDDISDVSHTNSIEKVYICSMDCRKLQRGDAVLIYRTSDKQGPAYYRSVVTSVCIIEEIKSRKDFSSLEDYLAYCKSYSVFTRQELTEWYNNKQPLYVVKMVYNGAFKKRITRGNLITNMGLNANERWGILSLTNEQFNEIIKQGDVYENLIIN